MLSKSIEIEGFTSNPGNDAHYVQNLTFEDITLGTSNNVQQEISLKYTRNISFNRVVQSDKKAPAVTAKDATYTVNGKTGVR